MSHSTVTREPSSKISRKNLVSSLLIGGILGTLVGIPIGWFSHQVYYQQRSGQVLLCRQSHLGQPEAELKQLCGSVY